MKDFNPAGTTHALRRGGAATVAVTLASSSEAAAKPDMKNAMTDIIERLRQHDGHLGTLVDEAADEIERLTRTLRRISDCEPLVSGDAWHMRSWARQALTGREG